MDPQHIPHTDSPTSAQLRTVWEHARATLLATALTIANDALAGRPIDVYRDTFNDATAAEQAAADAYFRFTPRPAQSPTTGEPS